MTPAQALQIVIAHFRAKDFEKCWEVHNQITTALHVLDGAISDPRAVDEQPNLRIAED